MPYSDFNAPNIPECEKDASAAAIACSALFELADYSENPYRTDAQFILQHLIQDFLAPAADYQSILHRASQKWGDAERGTIYADYYFLEALRRYEATTSGVAKTAALPMTFMLSQNYPNPFNAGTSIVFYLPRAEHLQADIFDAKGRHIAQPENAMFSAGPHRLVWHADSAPSGIYFLRLQAGHERQSIKMLIRR